jgi:type III secretion protein N (ATPase)
MSRRLIDTQFVSGVRALDALLPVGRGQRLGLFAMAGAGKSTLLGMIARRSAADVNVIALIGERGREVREFLEDALGEQGLAKSVVITATSDRPAMERVRAAHAASAIAEHFRATGRNVLLLMDSVTRFARALREIGLAVGEPAVRRGLPPSVFAELPKLFERAGNDAHGSITAFYAVLVEDEEGLDPVGEETRSLLDGHIVLARRLAASGIYPAIDVSASISRLANRVTSEDQQREAGRVRAWIAKYQEIELLLQIGEYKQGGDPLADDAVAKAPAIRDFLRQAPAEPAPIETTRADLAELAR